MMTLILMMAQASETKMGDGDVTGLLLVFLIIMRLDRTITIEEGVK